MALKIERQAFGLSKRRKLVMVKRDGEEEKEG